MKKMFVFMMVLTVCFVFQGIAAKKVDVTGKWDLTTKSPRGERTREVEFVQDGENLKVIMEGRDGNKIEAKGTVKGDQIEWTMTRETPRGEFSMTYKGTVSGDTMKGEVDFGGRGSMEWTANKKKN